MKAFRGAECGRRLAPLKPSVASLRRGRAFDRLSVAERLLDQRFDDPARDGRYAVARDTPAAAATSATVTKPPCPSSFIASAIKARWVPAPRLFGRRAPSAASTLTFFLDGGIASLD
jgi:hypothetical protein